ncbi:tRNA (adenosine(37)-N6)-threonylcarbamoyltransferase complex dimerization subunit type 1 TsaB [Leuconostocaceae bacterium ESL0958]|nr:tRNA (adenosine(37)-N6)-threonylcarbamoyltransferase complex dimerization subunit type 1 TsaB [Leuconostocaceae bacterium ESL0958]
MKSLLIDTSNQPLLVALAEDRQILTSFQENEPRKHSVDLLPAIEDQTADLGWSLDNLDRIVIAVGPGSFTGLRIGVTVGKVLAASLQKPLYALSSLQSLAAQVQAPADSLTLALFDARNDNVFAGLYQGHQVLLPDGHYPMAQVCSLLAERSEAVQVIGDGQHFEQTLTEQVGADRVTILSEEASLPNGAGLLALSLDATPVADIAALTPRYLRKTQAELNWEKQHPQGLQDQPYVFEV